MEVKIDKSFQKDTQKIKDKELLTKIAEVISSVQQAENITQTKNLKKLKGSQGNYRIKIGDYPLMSLADLWVPTEKRPYFYPASYRELRFIFQTFRVHSRNTLQVWIVSHGRL